MKILKKAFRIVKFSPASLDFRHYSVGNIVKLSPQSCYKLSPETVVENWPYYFEDGFRKVYPFYSYATSFAKGRWIDKKIIDFYSDECLMYTYETWRNRFQKGFVKVNKRTVDENYVLKHHNVLSAKVHRHELPVLDCPINILFEDDNLLVVDKPPSVPAHPCGLYFYNSIVNILANECNRPNLYIIYRIDRLSSGVFILGKSSKIAAQIQDDITKRNVEKEYVCRVEGNFPDDTVVCDKPIKNLHHIIGLHLVHSNGKSALTTFKKLSYNGKSSVVLCKPHTGRTHQIRVHLHYLGYPIINDPLYNSTLLGSIYGKKGAVVKPVSELLDELLEDHDSEWDFEKPHVDRSIQKEKKYLNYGLFKDFYMDQKPHKFNKDCSLMTYDEDCLHCHNYITDQVTLGMFLHARKYSSENWSFEAPLPFWALEDWNKA